MLPELMCRGATGSDDGVARLGLDQVVATTFMHLHEQQHKQQRLTANKHANWVPTGLGQQIIMLKEGSLQNSPPPLLFLLSPLLL